MKILLDTHVWIWCFSDPGRLSRRAMAALRSPDNELWLSPLSVWEAHLLVEKGKLKIKSQPHAWIQSMLRRMPLREAALTLEIALESRRLNLPHGDPADRFLAATARRLNLILVTADKHLLECQDVKTLEA